MKEGKIKVIESAVRPIKEVAGAFLEKPHITQEEIRGFAKKCAVYILKIKNPFWKPLLQFIFRGHDELFAFVVDVLSHESVSEIYERTHRGDDNVLPIPVSELEPYMAKIRSSFIAELMTALPSDLREYVVMLLEQKRQIKTDSGIVIKEGGKTSQEKFLKRASDVERVGEDVFTPLNRLEALRELYILQEQNIVSPYLAYAMFVVDSHSGDTLQQDMHFQTLDKFSFAHPLEETLKYFLDSIKGAQFLVDQGFTLTDLSLDNIGVFDDVEHGVEITRGKFFDFDSLALRGAFTNGYKTKSAHIPLEALLSKTVEPSAMVYELGITLEDIIARASYISHRDIPMQLLELQRAMVQPHPEDRPSVDSVVARLESVMQGKL